MLLLGVFIQILFSINAQTFDSTGLPAKAGIEKDPTVTRTDRWPSFIMPTACIGYGLVNLGKDAPFNIDLHYQHSTQSDWKLGHTHIDNYLQFVPAFGVYALDAFNIKPAHGFWQRSKIFIAGNILVAASVFSVKNLHYVERPDKSDRHSFPSGHTAIAFLGADFFYREFRYTKKWWIYSGYVVATAVGAYRIINNKHWLSDVVAGAGFGILSNRISYFILDKKSHRKRK